MATSGLLLTSTYKASVFSESYPTPPFIFFFSLKVLPMERSSDSQSKKNMDQILGFISFCFEIRSHLGHLLP